MGIFFGVEGFEPSPSRNGLGTTAVNMAADRCKEKNQGRLEKIKYQSLFEPEDALAVKKLGTMLRLAECFDIGMNNAITDIHCDILGDSVIFKTENEIDKSFELQEARTMEKAFEQLFKKRLEIL